MISILIYHAHSKNCHISDKFANVSDSFNNCLGTVTNDTDLPSNNMMTVMIGFRLFAICQFPLS